MDLTTLLGILIGFVLIVQGIGFGSIGNFIDVPSLIITCGGTLAAVFACYPIKVLKRMPAHFKILINGKKFDPMVYIEILVELAQLARRNGLLALEEKANEQTDPFLKQSLLLIVDATDPDKVREMLSNDLDYLEARHDESVDVYLKASATAPAFGMIGTLIGLINMLKSMNLESGGAGDLGQGMATALVTTFYGCIMANLIFGPIAKKLQIRNAEETLCKQIIIEGVLAIQSGENPKFLREKLVSFLAQKQREATSGEGEGGAEEGGKKKKGKK